MPVRRLDVRATRARELSRGEVRLGESPGVRVAPPTEFRVGVTDRGLRRSDRLEVSRGLRVEARVTSFGRYRWLIGRCTGRGFAARTSAALRVTRGLLVWLRYRATSLAPERDDGRLIVARLRSELVVGAREVVLGVRTLRVIERPDAASAARRLEVEGRVLVELLFVRGV